MENWDMAQTLTSLVARGGRDVIGITGVGVGCVGGS